ncbi:MAG TPA: elongation factor P [Clostridia bacterium]|nr:elongation factor P [Clostridia bacterium]
MISTNEFHTGVTIEVDGEIYSVVEFQHVKPGKGSAFVRTKLKNLKTGAVLERTFAAGEKLPRAHIDRREMQYLYNTGDEYVFMDTETFEQMTLKADDIGQKVKYLKENMSIWALFHEGTAFGVDFPNFVELKVVETEPGVKGDTAAGGSKPAKLETGAVVKVPLFVEVGDVIRVDTRTDEYIERVT